MKSRQRPVVLPLWAAPGQHPHGLCNPPAYIDGRPMGNQADNINARYRLLTEDARPPFQAHPGEDCGWDLSVVEPEDGSVLEAIPPFHAQRVPLGIAISVPVGTWVLLTGRSSTWSKYGLMCIPGVIDAGYRGPLFASVWNAGIVTFQPQPGMRLIQAIPIQVPNVTWWEVADLGNSKRGDGGFGSSGS